MIKYKNLLLLHLIQLVAGCDANGAWPDDLALVGSAYHHGTSWCVVVPPSAFSPSATPLRRSRANLRVGLIAPQMLATWGRLCER